MLRADKVIEIATLLQCTSLFVGTVSRAPHRLDRRIAVAAIAAVSIAHNARTSASTTVSGYGARQSHCFSYLSTSSIVHE
jgi:hypothetical protein